MARLDPGGYSLINRQTVGNKMAAAIISGRQLFHLSQLLAGFVLCLIFVIQGVSFFSSTFGDSPLVASDPALEQISIADSLVRDRRLLGGEPPQQPFPEAEQGFKVSRTLGDARAKMVYTDPLEYEGPIVEGWPPWQSRHMPSYFRVGEGSSSSLREHPFGVGCRNHRKKYTGVRLLIAVKSGVDGSQQRTVTRNTFQAVAKRKYPDVAVVSFIARTSDKELQAKVEAEQRIFCDIVQFDFVDHYNNITLKTVHILKFLLDHPTLSKSLQYALFTDDDSFVNVPKLYEELFIKREIVTSPISVYGHLFHGGDPMVPDPKKDYKDNLVDRSIVPSYMFNGQIPRYISGSGYILPRLTFQCLFEQAMFLEYLHVEDSFLTGFCAERCGFPRVRHPGFSSGRMETSEVKDSQILVHYMDEQRKRDMFERLSPLKGDEQEEENSEKERKNANSACVCP